LPSSDCENFSDRI
jgi:protein kinase A